LSVGRKCRFTRLCPSRGRPFPFGKIRSPSSLNRDAIRCSSRAARRRGPIGIRRTEPCVFGRWNTPDSVTDRRTCSRGASRSNSTSPDRRARSSPRRIPVDTAVRNSGWYSGGAPSRSRSTSAPDSAWIVSSSVHAGRGRRTRDAALTSRYPHMTACPSISRNGTNAFQRCRPSVSRDRR
jgi:hypothetical protein